MGSGAVATNARRWWAVVDATGNFQIWVRAGGGDDLGRVRLRRCGGDVLRAIECENCRLETWMEAIMTKTAFRTQRIRPASFTGNVLRQVSSGLEDHCK
jgi:hypothetical protein